MTSRDLESVARALVDEGKGILAADETIPTRRGGSTRSGSRRPSTAGGPTAKCSLPRLAPPSSSVAPSSTTRRSASNRASRLREMLLKPNMVVAGKDPALEAWHGRDEDLAAGQRAFYRRARCNAAACVGTYADEMEATSPSR